MTLLSRLLLLVVLLSVSSYSFFIGVGGFDIQNNNGQYSFRESNNSGINTNITELLIKQSNNVNAVTIWITKDWDTMWYPIETIQNEIIDRGYTPVFIFYWFGDDISVPYIKKNETKYFEKLESFLEYLKKINGQKIVILNPEYNMFGVESWIGMNDLFLKSFTIVRKDPQALVGPCVGDFGDYSKIDEPDEWSLFDPSINKAVKDADFIAFQEMRALTRNTKKQILLTPKRALNFSKYLFEKYNKPTILAYVAISTYGEEGNEIQKLVYKEFIHTVFHMRKEAKLIYFGLFHYFDYTGHVGYFKEAEEYFGLLESNGTQKPALEYFNLLK